MPCTETGISASGPGWTITSPSRSIFTRWPGSSRGTGRTRRRSRIIDLMPIIVLLMLAGAAHAQSWIAQTSNSTASLRGVNAVNEREVWASGTGGTYLHTTDGGTTWVAAKVPGAESLDFRGIRAVQGRTVCLMSSVAGAEWRIYKTSGAGAHWELQLTNPDPKGFFDSIVFWDAMHGIVIGDALNGHAEVRTTENGGKHWEL